MTLPPRAVDGRDEATIAAQILAKRPGYVPAWRGRGGAGEALVGAFAQQSALLARGLDQVPHRSKLAFLGSLAETLLPARPARVPLVFTLQAQAPRDVEVPANTPISAQIPTTPPSALGEPPPAREVTFSTERGFRAMAAKLVSVFGVDPANDTLADYSASAAEGFRLFDDLEASEHALYVGHDELLELSGEADLMVMLEVTSPPIPSLALAWEYHSAAGWLPFELLDDGTDGLQHTGTVTLRRRCGPKVDEATFGGRTSHFIRARLLEPITKPNPRPLPELDLVQLRVRFARDGIRPERLFHDSSRLDPDSDFLPFGATPSAPTSLHIACPEAFEREHARIHLRFELAQAALPEATASLQWDFHDGTTWRPIEGGVSDSTDALQKDGTVSFARPDDWKATLLHGETRLWLRARLNSGDYGQPLHIEAVTDSNGNVTLVTSPSTLAPPRVARLSLGYAYLTEPTLADHALAGNDGGFEDVSDAARWRRRPFVPFTPMSGTEAHLVLGFDAPLGEGLVSLFIDAQGQPEGDAPSLSGSSFDWHYLSPTGWRPLSVYDETGGLKRPGLLQLVRPQDLVSDHAAMGERGSIRASLRQGEPMRPIPIGGVWLNAIWAAQREVVKSDIVGHADGRRSQVFELRRKLGSLLGPVTVDVREWVGEGRDWEHVAEKVEPSRLRLERDRATGAVTEVWIRWQQVAHFHDSGPTDRHYVVEVERGDIAFGDGEQGMLPPVGARIVAGYETGGGAVGNLPAGSVNRLSGMVPFVDGVTNPVPARGGADIERAERVEGRGPQHLRHRDRAVCEADYEWLATEASPAVLHARCDGLVGPAGFAQRGWVTLRVLPQGEGPRPEPSGELMRRVWQHLARRAPAVVAGRIRVLGPRYLPVGIEVRVAPQSVDVAAAVEARVRALLADFLHPTRGGPRGDGWRFGESLLASWIAMRLERLDGVDHATDLRLVVSGSIVEERVDVAADEIVAAGEQLVIMTLGAV